MALLDPFQGYEQIPILLMAIYSMGPIMGLPITMNITMTMVLIATALVVTTLTLGPSILGIWVTLALLSNCHACYNSSIRQLIALYHDQAGLVYGLMM